MTLGSLLLRVISPPLTSPPWSSQGLSSALFAVPIKTSSVPSMNRFRKAHTDVLTADLEAEKAAEDVRLEAKAQADSDAMLVEAHTAQNWSEFRALDMSAPRLLKGPAAAEQELRRVGKKAEAGRRPTKKLSLMKSAVEDIVPKNQHSAVQDRVREGNCSWSGSADPTLRPLPSRRPARPAGRPARAVRPAISGRRRRALGRRPDPGPHGSWTGQFVHGKVGRNLCAHRGGSQASRGRGPQ